jgi:hypothetical protein
MRDSARRKYRFVYCCVIVGTCFDVTVLARRKYATLLLEFRIACFYSQEFTSIYNRVHIVCIVMRIMGVKKG